MSTNPVTQLRILIAEDNEVNRRLALLMLNRLGYTADVVINGREAVDAIRRQPYDVVLMDCHMPELDGYAATGEIRVLTENHPDRPRPRIIAVTAAAMSDDRAKCLAAGMDDYVTKPVKTEALRAALELAMAPVPMEKRATAPVLPVCEEEPELKQTTDLLAAELGADSVKELIEAYLLDTPERLKEMEALAGGDDQVTLRRLAHSLKGTAHLFGLSRTGNIAAGLETAAAGEQRTSQRGMVGELNALFAGSKPVLERRMRELVSA